MQWWVGGGNLIWASLGVFARVFTDIICTASDRTENQGEQEFYLSSRFHGANPAKAICNLGAGEISRVARVQREFSPNLDVTI